MALFGPPKHICGFYYIIPSTGFAHRSYLPQVSLTAHTTIVSATSRTVLTQTFLNPQPGHTIPELRYTFPLYDGVSVVGFTCTIDKDRVIHGVVKERNEARKTYEEAVDKGETAGLLEQLPEASDVFTTTIGNVSGAEIKVELTYLGELKHDAEVDGIRFTIPTSIAPRYGDYPGGLAEGSNAIAKGGINIVVDAEMPEGINIKGVQSPSHPISVTVGNTSTGAATGATMSLRKASATLSLGTTELDRDFVLQVVATDVGNPVAVLETHPTIPNHRAIMATLVPKFNLPSSRPEIVFVCDRSGSMGTGNRIQALKTALHIFLKSLPLGVRFNICSFGSDHELLFKKGSVLYDASTLKEATSYVDAFAANFGGTEMYRPLEEVLMKRHKDMDLEIFLLTDGEVWNQGDLFGLINTHVQESKGAARVFTLGIGDEVSHALIEGVATAGNGFAQTVMDHEKMNSKVVRMLKAALTPHILDYTVEVGYASEPDTEKQATRNNIEDGDDGFEIVEKVMDALSINVNEPTSQDLEKRTAGNSKQPISLFNPAADPDADLADELQDKTAGGRYAGVPIVSEPTLLQAPFVIPPLYPFSRTTLYLLLSENTTQETPTAIIVKGTSVHGPLEIKIPVTVLGEPAETIHQLAARKAIRELEDGRGWIFHAKSATGEDQGKLLRDIYPGRFPDMVERETVRLGVTYQVGGKSCSFVAVEHQEDGQTQATCISHMQPADRKHTLPGGGAPVSGGSALFSATAAHGPNSSGLFGASSRAHKKRVAPMAARMSALSARSLCGGGVFRGTPAAAPAPAPAIASHLTSQSGTQEDEGDDSAEDCGFGLFDDDSYVPPAMVKAAIPEEDKLESVVSLQTFEGYWEWNESLFDKLGIDWKKVLKGQSMAQSATLATAIVLAFLEAKLADREDEWEMLADKARDWLKMKLQPRDVQEHVSLVRDLLD